MISPTLYECLLQMFQAQMQTKYVIFMLLVGKNSLIRLSEIIL